MRMKRSVAATRTEETDDLGIPAVHAKRDPVFELFKAAGKDLAAYSEEDRCGFEAAIF